MNKKVILRVQYIRKYLLKKATNLNLKPEPENCPPRSGGWRVSRKRGRVFSYWRVSQRRGRVFSYLAAYVLGLVLGLCSFLPPPLMGGMVLATSKKTKDSKFPLGAYPSCLIFFVPPLDGGYGVSN